MSVSVEVLRGHGVQVTAQRLAVLQAVSARPHATADVVAEIARSEIGAISKQSVYDALATLVDAGIVRRIEPAGSAARYETTTIITSCAEAAAASSMSTAPWVPHPVSPRPMPPATPSTKLR